MSTGMNIHVFTRGYVVSYKFQNPFVDNADNNKQTKIQSLCVLLWLVSKQWQRSRVRLVRSSGRWFDGRLKSSWKRLQCHSVDSGQEGPNSFKVKLVSIKMSRPKMFNLLFPSINRTSKRPPMSCSVISFYESAMTWQAEDLAGFNVASIVYNTQKAAWISILQEARRRADRKQVDVVQSFQWKLSQYSVVFSVGNQCSIPLSLFTTYHHSSPSLEVRIF